MKESIERVKLGVASQKETNIDTYLNMITSFY
jgi:hypothetical protein